MRVVRSALPVTMYLPPPAYARSQHRAVVRERLKRLAGARRRSRAPCFAAVATASCFAVGAERDLGYRRARPSSDEDGRCVAPGRRGRRRRPCRRDELVVGAERGRRDGAAAPGEDPAHLQRLERVAKRSPRRDPSVSQLRGARATARTLCTGSIPSFASAVATSSPTFATSAAARRAPRLMLRLALCERPRACFSLTAPVLR